MEFAHIINTNQEKKNPDHERRLKNHSQQNAELNICRDCREAKRHRREDRRKAQDQAEHFFHVDCTPLIKVMYSLRKAIRRQCSFLRIQTAIPIELRPYYTTKQNYCQ